MYENIELVYIWNDYEIMVLVTILNCYDVIEGLERCNEHPWPLWHTRYGIDKLLY